MELEAGNIGSAPIVSECVDRRLPLRQICVILIQHIAEVVEFDKAVCQTHCQSLLVWRECNSCDFLTIDLPCAHSLTLLA